MSEQEKEPLQIDIGEQSFRIRILSTERERYARISQRVNQTLQDILNGGVVGGPRALAMAAFQLGVELEEAQETLRKSEQGRSRLDELINRIDQATK